jgi:RNA polymerase sigma factor (sigma-70 family)
VAQGTAQRERTLFYVDQYPAFSDLELWRLASVEPDAFGELFRRHARAVHAVCFWRTASSATADDLTSVVFLEAWRLRDRVTITGESVLPWLLGVANNCARNAERSARRYRQALERLPRVDARSDEDEQVDRLDAEVSMSFVKRALDALSDSERDLVVLVLWSQLTYEEAAVMLKIPVGTVRSRVSRLRDKLQHSLIALNTMEKESS